ncbi:Rapid ALkalinization Factor [Parasponia andersonii]|uniref:Rapid ALkalinization Factor n=1 Tax=Parasponia andersonii TaxID=3476 RepID=A0A2P5B2K2_PARAD|nr:Rapid ALkalinization Factor [Parasponia andersonii]
MESSSSSSSSSSSPSPSLLKLLTLCFATVVVILGSSSSFVEAQLDDTSLKLMTDAFEWPTTMPLYEELAEDDEDIDGGFVDRRSLFWRGGTRYYISYGALSANRIPCPPRSGRSYYTHNCFKARGPVHPYSRDCSRITRCRL